MRGLHFQHRPVWSSHNADPESGADGIPCTDCVTVCLSCTWRALKCRVELGTLMGDQGAGRSCCML